MSGGRMSLANLVWPVTLCVVVRLLNAGFPTSSSGCPTLGGGFELMLHHAPEVPKLTAAA